MPSGSKTLRVIAHDKDLHDCMLNQTSSPSLIPVSTPKVRGVNTYTSFCPTSSGIRIIIDVGWLEIQRKLRYHICKQLTSTLSYGTSMIIPTPYHKVSAINPLPISLQWLYEFMHHSYSLRVVDENHYLIYFSMSYKKSNNFYRKFDRSLLTSSPVLRLLQFPFDIILQIQFWYQS